MKDELKVVLNPSNIELEPIIGLDLETSGLQAWECKIRLIIISTSAHIYILDPTKYHHQYLTEVFQSMHQCDKVIAHNGKFDCGFIYCHHGVLLRNWYCTQIASQVITNGKKEFKGRHSLPEVIERYLNEKLPFSANKKLLQKSFTSQYSLDRFTDKQLRYTSDDVKFLIPLYKVQQNQIVGLKLKAIIKLENDLLPILAKMEMEGCLIDAVGWRELIKTYWIPDVERIEGELDAEVSRLVPSSKQRRKAELISYSLFDENPTKSSLSYGGINYASSDQVLELFRQLGEEVPQVEDNKKKKEDDNTGDNNFNNYNYNLFIQPGGQNSDAQGEDEEVKFKDSLDEGVLTTYINERPHSKMKPFIKLLIEYRVACKRISTYGEKFLAKLDFGGRIHTGYTQTFTDTGRLSSKAPNLQNIPSPEKGKPETDIRRFFISRPGYSLITCDMSGAEVAIAADYSQEPLLLDALRKGIDMHSDLASISFSIIFGQPITISKREEPISIKGHEFVPGELRDRHKSVVFAKFYKAGAKRIYSVLAEYINLFHPENKRIEIASEISKALDKRMPRLSKYLDGLIERAQSDLMLRSDKLGRIRYFDEDVYGEAANYPIQGTNANALKMAMLEVFLYFESCGFDARIVMNIHDELVCEVADEPGIYGPGNNVNMAAIKVKEIMSNALSYFLKTIEGGASIQINKYWKK